MRTLRDVHINTILDSINMEIGRLKYSLTRISIPSAEANIAVCTHLGEVFEEAVSALMDYPQIELLPNIQEVVSVTNSTRHVLQTVYEKDVDTNLILSTSFINVANAIDLIASSRDLSEDIGIGDRRIQTVIANRRESYNREYRRLYNITQKYCVSFDDFFIRQEHLLALTKAFVSDLETCVIEDDSHLNEIAIKQEDAEQKMINFLFDEDYKAKYFQMHIAHECLVELECLARKISFNDQRVIKLDEFEQMVKSIVPNGDSFEFVVYNGTNWEGFVAQNDYLKIQVPFRSCTWNINFQENIGNVMKSYTRQFRCPTPNNVESYLKDVNMLIRRDVKKAQDFLSAVLGEQND